MGDGDSGAHRGALAPSSPLTSKAVPAAAAWPWAERWQPLGSTARAWGVLPGWATGSSSQRDHGRCLRHPRAAARRAAPRAMGPHGVAEVSPENWIEGEGP